MFSIENLPLVGRYYNCKPSLNEEKLAAFYTRNFSAKFIIVGDSGVGKTCLLNRIAHDKFSAEYKSTIGASFTAVEVTVNNIPMKMAMWDMAGQEQFNSVNRHYFRGANIVFLCFDLTNNQTFKNVSKWLNVVKENTSGVFATFLVGCKSDLPSKVLDGEIKDFCENNKCEYFATSAKDAKMTTDLAKRAALIAAISIQDMREKSQMAQVTTAQNKPETKPQEVQLTSQAPADKKKGCC